MLGLYSSAEMPCRLDASGDYPYETGVHTLLFILANLLEICSPNLH